METMHRVGRFSASNVGGNGHGLGGQVALRRVTGIIFTVPFPPKPQAADSSMDVAQTAARSSKKTKPRNATSARPTIHGNYCPNTCWKKNISPDKARRWVKADTWRSTDNHVRIA